MMITRIFVSVRRSSSSSKRCGTFDDFSGHFFLIFEIIICCFVVAICDLVHAVEAMYSLP